MDLLLRSYYGQNTWRGIMAELFQQNFSTGIFPTSNLLHQMAGNSNRQNFASIFENKLLQVEVMVCYNTGKIMANRIS